MHEIYHIITLILQPGQIMDSAEGDLDDSISFKLEYLHTAVSSAVRCDAFKNIKFQQFSEESYLQLKEFSELFEMEKFFESQPKEMYHDIRDFIRRVLAVLELKFNEDEELRAKTQILFNGLLRVS